MENLSSADFIARSQAVSAKHLKPVQCEPQSPQLVQWASLFFKERQCFGNALKLSAVDEFDYVLGYVLMKDFGVAIEHAWNRSEQGYFDLTAQLFWKDSASAEYFELIVLKASDALDVFDELGGVDQMALRRSSDYKHLFMR